MFVIVQCWYNLRKDEILEKTHEEKIGLTMKHAGVAISVTSITDVFAFGVGSITVSLIFTKHFNLYNIFQETQVMKKFSLKNKMNHFLLKKVLEKWHLLRI